MRSTSSTDRVTEYAPTAACAAPDTVIEYHARRNKFERFRGLSELISRFEFVFFVAKNIFFERFEFLVCSKFNHTHHVAVHVPVLWPVFDHAIPVRMLWRP